MSLRNPVKYPVKYYSWQDAQAPQLTDADGVIKTILKACLVTGYGSKAGAGWTSLFEDAHRIVLRRPLRTGNPPDIKIENGTITGTTVRHRIVAQDNPTGLDDATELSAVNLLARDNRAGKEWHLVVTDFAFIFCYQIGEQPFNGNRNSVLYVGGAKKMLDSAEEYFFATLHKNVEVTGLANGPITSITSSSTNYMFEMRLNINYVYRNILTIDAAEKYFNNDFFAQKVLIDKVAELPFYAAVTQNYDNLITSMVSINNRQMLRYVNKSTQSGSIYDFRPLYIPLDYWEL